MKTFINCISVFFHFYILRPMWKFILRKITGRCELLRITYNEPSGSKRTKKIEFSLKKSKSKELKIIPENPNINVAKAVKDIIRIKNINIYAHMSFEPAIKVCISQICGYKKLIADITNLRKSPYLSENNEHEEKLQKLWSLLQPDEPLEARVTKQWTTIGFQGSDPKTDFRGMGLLGLENLVFFAEDYTDISRRILLQSRNPAHEYSFAIVGINITAMIVDLLLKNHLKNHFYNSIRGEPNLQDFHNVYVRIFCDFHKNWLRDKPGIMNFNIYKDKYMRTLLEKLKRKDYVLPINE